MQKPLDLGADVVMHSVTKYINGHSDVVMGVLATSNEELYNKLKFFQNCAQQELVASAHSVCVAAIGAVPSPFDCYQAMRGMKTLHIRCALHSLLLRLPLPVIAIALCAAVCGSTPRTRRWWLSSSRSTRPSRRSTPSRVGDTMLNVYVHVDRSPTLASNRTRSTSSPRSKCSF